LVHFWFTLVLLLVHFWFIIGLLLVYGLYIFGLLSLYIQISFCEYIKLDLTNKSLLV